MAEKVISPIFNVPARGPTRGVIKMRSEQTFVEANAEWDAGNFQRALDLFRAAAAEGDTNAFNSIGYFWDHGIGVKRDTEKAFEWYLKGARHKDVCAYSNLGILYRDQGKLRRAKYWFEKALMHDDADAAIELAKLYLLAQSRNYRMVASRYLNTALASTLISDDSRDEAKALLESVLLNGA